MRVYAGVVVTLQGEPVEDGARGVYVDTSVFGAGLFVVDDPEYRLVGNAVAVLLDDAPPHTPLHGSVVLANCVSGAAIREIADVAVVTRRGVRLVVVESPYAGDVERNLEYLAACMRDCLQRGEAPFASHGLYTMPGCLDDDDPEERELGIAAGLAWGDRAAARVVYTDLGISSGMKRGIDRARAIGQAVEQRVLGWSAPVPYEVRRETQHVPNAAAPPLGDYVCMACAGGVATAEAVAVPYPAPHVPSRTSYAHPKCQKRAEEIAKKDDGYAAAVHGGSR